MTITTNELKENLDKYLLMAENEDICITHNGKAVAKLSAPYSSLVETVKSLAGIIPADITLQEARCERMADK